MVVHDWSVWEGIIPARAGFTRERMVVEEASGDHPRSRGVYLVPALTMTGCWGSSPLARGLLSRPEEQVALGGIIPARAGFTPGRSTYRGRRADHPRSRGVYNQRWAKVVTLYGSSPLARGLLSKNAGEIIGTGIIPARAGFTSSAGSCATLRRDHPRSRGVYSRSRSRTARTSGSSPLARGLRRPHSPCRPGPGIIPARAGFTLGGPGCRP